MDQDVKRGCLPGPLKRRLQDEHHQNYKTAMKFVFLFISIGV
jgi:hypothetical protein